MPLPQPSAELAAWREFCGALADAGRASARPRPPRRQPRSVRGHPAFRDASGLLARPCVRRERDLGLHRLNDLLTPWGGPNADNVYRYARDRRPEHVPAARADGQLRAIAAGLARRQSASEGERHPRRGQREPTSGSVRATRSTSSSAPSRMTGGHHHPAGHPDALDPRVLLRLAPARARHAACSNGSTVPARPAGSPRRSQRPASSSPSSLTYWADYMSRGPRPRRGQRVHPSRARSPAGLKTMLYSFCFWSLAAGRGARGDVPRAATRVLEHCSCTSYGWFEALDLGRQTSLNHKQTTLGPDDTVTAVLSAPPTRASPTGSTREGRPEGLLTFRGAWLTRRRPKAETRVVQLADRRQRRGCRRAAGRRRSPRGRDRRPARTPALEVPYVSVLGRTLQASSRTVRRPRRAGARRPAADLCRDRPADRRARRRSRHARRAFAATSSALALPGGIDYVLAFSALARLDAVTTGLNPRYTPAERAKSSRGRRRRSSSPPPT